VSIVTIIIIIGIISSVINALQPKKDGRRGYRNPQFLSRRSKIGEAPSPIKRTVIGTHERKKSNEERAPVRFAPQASTLSKLKEEDKRTDFGDPETAYSPIESMEIRYAKQKSKVQRFQPTTSPRKTSLDLKPTPKKLAETLILAELLSVPRAKRPHQPLGYKKR
jgi:hypothetical protein